MLVRSSGARAAWAAPRGRRRSTSPAPRCCRAGARESGRPAAPRRRSVRVQLRAHVGVQRQIQRLQLSPQAVELLRERVGRHVVLRAPHRAGVGEAQLRRAFVRQLDEPDVALASSAAPIVCHPSHTSRSRAGLRSFARISVISSMSRQASSDRSVRRAPESRSTCRVPYTPSIDATSCASSAASFGSAGAAIVSEFFSTVSWRRSIGRQLHAVVACGACLAESVTAVMYAVVRARGERLGVGRDVRLLHPAGLVGFDCRAEASCRWPASGTSRHRLQPDAVGARRLRHARAATRSRRSRRMRRDLGAIANAELSCGRS